ncbi:sulfatase family protein [Piscinibacter sp.]|uniref:sulfatase family protein n=1 Tax=Piscinibacter sp. TaxID=1903157 RepID=UPI002BA12C64|nr:sulfatase-like hydrolase/transferase [Albitalea sp.]HUG21406.1 sulfatase-like hydrolase/transferase [Albitalea sp.]
MTSRPNFVFVLADDLGYADLGCTGAREPVSPHLDRLAEQGLLFSHGYSNSPVCSPTRFALITGRYQYRLRGAAEEPLAGRARGSTTLGLPPEHPTLPSLLRDAGYTTALVGKWHLGYLPHFGPLKSGYQSFFGARSGGVDYFSHRDMSGNHDLWEHDEPCHREGEYLTDLISDSAVQYIESRRSGEPFMLSVHYTAPHWPWEAREDAAESARIAGRISHLDGGSIATYRRMIRQMDEGIGRIAAALAARGFADDTLIVFTSDNGGERYSDNWPFVGQKMDLMEGGIRVPLIARWPARIKPGLSHTPTITMDWAATMLAAAGVEAHPEYPLDGVDLAPLFDDPQWAPRRDLCWRMLHRQQRALHSDRWKYLRVDGHDYLFDLSHDERERANLAQREPARLAELRTRWEAWAATMPGIPSDAAASLVFGEADMPRASH